MVFNFFLINPTRQILLFGQSVTVWGAGLEVPGAALGTALSTAIGGLLALGVLLLRDGPLCIRKPGSWRITSACLRNLWRVGTPLAAERAALSSAQVLLVRIVSGLGTVAIAANSLGVSAEGLCYMAGYGIQDASIALIGQAVGAHRRDMAKRFAWLCTMMGMGIMALSGVLMWLFAPALMSIFTADAAVIALGAQMLRIEAFAEPMFGASIVASAVGLGIVLLHHPVIEAVARHAKGAEFQSSTRDVQRLIQSGRRHRFRPFGHGHLHRRHVGGVRGPAHGGLGPV